LENVHAGDEDSEIARQRLSDAIRLPALDGLFWHWSDPVAIRAVVPRFRLIQTEHFGRPQWLVRDGKAFPVPASVDLAPTDGFDGDLTW
jgi:hypothetical protein